ncbi:MAG: hypothetical protein MZV70_08760 [Desulfobacterales bacterium]|nr:hypothetical protein [Desulfobacterales bacterium]
MCDTTSTTYSFPTDSESKRLSNFQEANASGSSSTFSINFGDSISSSKFLDKKKDAQENNLKPDTDRKTTGVIYEKY